MSSKPIESATAIGLDRDAETGRRAAAARAGRAELRRRRKSESMRSPGHQGARFACKPSVSAVSATPV